MEEAERERALADSPEGDALMDAICKAVDAYSDFLERHNLIWDWGDCDNPDGMPRMKATALVVTKDYGEDMGGIEFVLKDGSIDRVYGNGTNPDPYGRGLPTSRSSARTDDAS